MLVAPGDPPMIGRVDDEGELDTRRVHQIVRSFPDGMGRGDRVLIGFRSDLGVAANHGRVGARQGPVALREYLANGAVHFRSQLFDMGDLQEESNDLTQLQIELSECVRSVLDLGGLPLILGGGHEIAYGTWMGIANHLGLGPTLGPRVGIVNIDAHFDLRSDSVPSSGTPFFQISRDCEDRDVPFNYSCLGVSKFSNTRALFDRAESLGVDWVLDLDLQTLPEGLVEAISDRYDYIHLSVDFDSLPSQVISAVSAPASLGVPTAVVERLIRGFVSSGKVVAVDFAEFNPTYDVDGRSARAAARLILAAVEG